MRKNKFFIAGLVTVFVALVSLTLVSSTWAKYTSTVEGTDSATVAKWEWNYKGAKIESGTVSFDLFTTILDTKDSNAETDVAANLIAPGTKGSFEFSLQNLSEVNATYSVTFSSELVGGTGYLPIVFTLKDSGGNVIASDTQLSAFNAELLEVEANMGAAADTYTVEWEWVYEGNNDADTALGEAAQAGNVKYNVAMRIVMTQVD